MDYGIHMPAGTADQIVRFQTVHASNLAGLSVPGFKAEVPYATRLQEAIDDKVVQPRFDTRHMPVPGKSQTNFTSGPLRYTGRALDVAITGNGWLVVDVDGTRMLTRNGQMEVSAGGELRAAGGLPVMGQGGAVSLPEYTGLTIGSDGVISIVPRGGQPSEIVEADRIMLVNPREQQLARRTGSMFEYTGDDPLAVDPNVELVSGQLEMANTDAVKELINFLALGREFEMNVRMMNAFSDITLSGDQLLQESTL